MRFDQSQQMRLGQQMKLAPRMIQSMEILQMPLAALEERIEQELESNVALEQVEPGDEAREAGEQEEGWGAASEEPAGDVGERELNVDESGGGDDFERLESFETAYPDAVESEGAPGERTRAREFEYEPGSYSASRMAGERDGKMDAMASAAARGASLSEQLLEQWSLADVDEALVEPGRRIIAHLDDDGYLRTDLSEIAEKSADGAADEETLERALMAVQLFLDPPGIGARDTRECLLLQLDALEDEQGASGGVEDARVIVRDCYDDLLHNRVPKISEKTGMGTDRIKRALEVLRRLRLHPGRALVEEPAETVRADAIVEYDEDSDRYFAYLADGRLPTLRLNREYALLAKDRATPKSDRDFLRTNISNAQWLIEAVEQRRQTLQRVLNVVVEAQREVFDYGPSALKPLPMTQVADQLGVHVATVSRAVAGKHVLTPRGVFPLRWFFTGGTQTESGEAMSWEAIRAAMGEIIEREDKRRPLSDEAISKALKERGIDIARRTVAKYRDQMDIPPARMRKQF